MDLADLARRLALSLVPMILSLSVHEFAHAKTAQLLGDDTARLQGRLTLDPRAHVDPVGTLLLPVLSVLMGGMAFFGWARPVPVRPDRFRERVPRRLGMAVVSAAGPVSNLVIAILAAAGLSSLVRLGVVMTDAGKPTAVALLLDATLTLNVGLAMFNLLPVPPLDGHRLVPAFLDKLMRPLERYGFAVLMAVFLFLPGVAEVVFYRPLAAVTGLLRASFGV